jgi:hypothetical protein
LLLRAQPPRFDWIFVAQPENATMMTIFHDCVDDSMMTTTTTMTIQVMLIIFVVSVDVVAE